MTMKDHDYMNDPRMEEFGHLPYPLQEVRSWRLAAQDAKEGMTWEQEKAYYANLRKELEDMGFKFKYAEEKPPRRNPTRPRNRNLEKAISTPIM